MVETVGYKATKEMDSALFSDALIFRNKQIEKVAVVTLKSAFDEIEILWNQEVKYRQEFSIDGDYAKIPVFFSKINGVYKDTYKYWKEIKNLFTKNTVVYRKRRIVHVGLFRKLKIMFSGFIKHNELNIDKVQKSKLYKYSLIRPQIQSHILEKLKFIIDKEIIKGTFTNGVANIIIGVALNLPKNVIRLLQDFDFTKENPKIIYIDNSNKIMKIEDVILLVLLHYLGFDVLIYVPSGLNCIDVNLNANLINEFQLENNVEKIKIPNFFWI